MSASVSNLDDVVALATSTSNQSAVASAIRALVRKDANHADTVLAAPSGGGQDPLAILNPTQHTIAYLYILPASVHIPAIEAFCKLAQGHALRLAPDAVNRFSSSFTALAYEGNNIREAVGPLRDLLFRYPETLAHLTPLHAIFLRACVKAQYYTFALPVLEAEELFEIVVSSPAQHTPSALQLDALNKLSLIQLMTYGKASSCSLLPTPKYTHPLLLRIFKAGPYSALAKTYPGTTTQSLTNVAEKEQKTWAQDDNTGLVKQVLDRAPRWQVRKLTDTYVTLSLPEIGKAVNIESEAEIRALVISMIEAREIHATLSAEGTVTFHDTPVTFSKEGIDRLLHDAQQHARLVAEFDRELERSRDFLQRAANNTGRDGFGMDDMEMGMPGMGMREGIWDEGDY
ncbi:hypothetical protein BKA62DRAFT_767472 [Auriculariales sp. MPI-PUGE-AT-0066]|nr:hypothetical protein BKA62DRAFT_767472 [Auriculariales sp. MPI-PUGE-AT-0066]